MRNALLLVAICTFVAVAGAQVAVPAQPQPEPSHTMPTAQAALAPGNLVPLLSQVEQAGMTANGDVARLRIDKWKMDSNSKSQAEANSRSVQRNLTEAMPGMIASVRSAPDNMAAAFKLYRNLNALYDVLSSLAESAGAFGPKYDYQALATDVGSIDKLRRNVADQLEQLAAFKDAQIGRLMVQVRQAQAAAAAAPPKKVVVDDNEPSAKKPARKKKPATKPAPASTTPPAQTPPQ